MLQIYALIIVETGDFVCAIGESLNNAIETACSALDLQPGDLEPYDISESLAADMLAEQYGGACICSSEQG